MGMSAMLAVLADPSMPEGALDMAVELGDSVMTHRRRFSVATTRSTVIDLLGLDAENPRSLRYQVEGLRTQIARLPGAEIAGHPEPPLAAIMRIQVDLATETPEGLTRGELWSMRARIAGLSDLLTEAFFS